LKIHIETALKQTISNIKSLVKEQISRIRDPLVKAALEKALIEPTDDLREWDYSTTGELFECWNIVIDKTTNTSIIYSEFGYGPKNPWGIVSTVVKYFGMDSSWFNNLEDCFLETFIAADLPIWRIERFPGTSQREIIAENLTSDEAFKIIESKIKQNTEYYIRPRKI